MANYRRTSHLKQELEREEALLKTIKDKLVDQLQRLKVEELALVANCTGLSNSTNSSRAASSTVSYFSTNIQVDHPLLVGTDGNEMNEDVNSIPLIDLTRDLTNNSLISSSCPGMDQEEEEEEED